MHQDLVDEMNKRTKETTDQIINSNNAHFKSIQEEQRQSIEDQNAWKHQSPYITAPIFIISIFLLIFSYKLMIKVRRFLKQNDNGSRFVSSYTLNGNNLSPNYGHTNGCLWDIAQLAWIALIFSTFLLLPVLVFETGWFVLVSLHVPWAEQGIDTIGDGY